MSQTVQRRREPPSPLWWCGQSIRKKDQLLQELRKARWYTLREYDKLCKRQRKWLWQWRDYTDEIKSLGMVLYFLDEEIARLTHLQEITD